MAGRVNTNALPRRVFIPSVIIALIAMGLLGVSGSMLRRASAARSLSGMAPVGAATVNGVAPSASLVSLEGLQFPFDEGAGGYLIGEYEGQYSAATRQFTVQPRTSGGTSSTAAGRTGASARFNPGAEVPRGGAGFSFSVVNSAFVNTGNNPATVSGEIQLTNTSSATLYNTRLIFTAFKIGTAAGAAAENVPGPNGFAYYNDGLIPFGGKLNVSRAYGDIAPGANARNIWNFATTNQPPSFFFIYKVVADLGVATESVQPAAVQVSSSTGASVVISGRGFSTPSVQLLDAANNVVSSPAVSNPTATSLTVTIPANTAPGVYSLRVTNQGATPGQVGSSTLIGRLTVTAAPDAAHTISGSVSSFSDTGPYLVSGNVTIGSAATILAGTVFYVANGATVTIAGAGNLTANGGVPGVPGGAGIANPNQIVFTSQRAAGAALPASGAWGGIDATSASTATLLMRNVVVEYGGSASGAGINLTGSGRTLRLADSIVRNSSGAGIAAGGVNDSLVGFTRNRLENNGTTAANPAVLVSGNAALGLYEIPGAEIATATSVGDPGYFYSSANEFSGNQVNGIQIGTDADAAGNDFTKSGVLVGQGSAPIIIRGSSSNPSIIGVVESVPSAMAGGNSAAAALATELTINPAAIIQLAAGMDLQVGDYPTNRVGCLAANGFAGFYQGAQAATSNKYIEFDKIPGGGNFGSIFFTRLSMTNCILNNVRIQNGGAGSRGPAPLIVEVISLAVTNSVVDGGLLDILGALVDTKGTSFLNTNSQPIIETIAGGALGDRNLGTKAILSNPTSLAIDPLGRGLYVADTPSGASYVRFLNTTRNTVVIGGVTIPAGMMKTLGGGGTNLGENVPASQADLGTVTGLAVSPDGGVLYFIDSVLPLVRSINISAAARSIAGVSVAVGNVQTFAEQGFGSSLYALATHPTTGDVYVIDSTPGVNKVFKIAANAASTTTTPETVAGNGSTSTKDDDPFSAGDADMIPLFGPRALAFNGQNLIIADTGHARVIQVDTQGKASLIGQFPPKATTPNPYPNNPYTAGLAVFNGKVYLGNGNAQDVIRIDTNGNPPGFTPIAGSILTPCDYTGGSNCGDAGPATQALFSLTSRTAIIPLVGMAADSKGIYVADQGPTRGRIRYINLSNTAVEVAGINIDAGNIDTVAGAGLNPPFDGAIATSGALSSPVGVAMDAEGNLWISDTLTGKLRFVNRGSQPKILLAGSSAEQEVLPGAIVSVNKDSTGGADPAPASQAVFDTPQGLFATAEGIYICDSKKGPPTQGSPGRRTGLIRFINTTGSTVTFYSGGSNPVNVAPGFIATIAGGSTIGDVNNVGDGTNPLTAKFVGPADILVHPTNGNIYVADAGQRRVRLINRSTGAISTLGLPTTSPNEYTGLAIDSAGRILVANPGNKQIHREKTAGGGSSTTGWDNLLTGGILNRPRDVVEGLDGALYVTGAGDPSPASSADHRIVRITLSGATGTGTTYFGSNGPGYLGDGGPITNARIDITPQPIDVKTVGSAVFIRTTVNIIRGLNGELIFTDTNNNAIRRIR